MTYAGLVERLTALLHRSDLQADMPWFAQAATLRINRRFGLELDAPGPLIDSNEVLTQWPDLYVYAAAQAAFEHLNNGENAAYYQGAFEDASSRMNITELEFPGEPPIIEPERSHVA